MADEDDFGNGMDDMIDDGSDQDPEDEIDDDHNDGVEILDAGAAKDSKAIPKRQMRLTRVGRQGRGLCSRGGQGGERWRRCQWRRTSCGEHGRAAYACGRALQW